MNMRSTHAAAALLRSPASTRWSWSAARPQFLLELLVACTVLGAAQAFLMPGFLDATVRARLTEAVVSAGGGRLEVVEGLALGIADAQGGATSSNMAPKAEEYLSGRATAARRVFEFDTSSAAERAARQQRALESRLQGEGQQASRYVDDVRVAGGQVIVSGRLQGSASSAYELRLTAATKDVAAPQVVAWLCGEALPPPGWVAQASPVGPLPPRQHRAGVCNPGAWAP